MSVDLPDLKLLSLRCLSRKGFIQTLTLKSEHLEICELGFVDVMNMKVKKEGVVIRKISSVVVSLETIE